MLYCPKCNYLFNIRKTVPGESETGILFCENCTCVKKLDDNTLIYQTKYNVPCNKNQSDDDLEFLKLDIYQRKMLDKCPHKSCPSKKKKVEVVIYRSSDFDCFYICTSCNKKIETI